MAAGTTARGVIKSRSFLRPAEDADHESRSIQRQISLAVVLVGFMTALSAFVGSIVNADLIANNESKTTILANDAWIFGVATMGMVITQSGIVIVLYGIIRRLWMRVESVKVGVARLMPDVPNKKQIDSPRIETPFGWATHTVTAPPPKLVHRMAYMMWAPMWLMGVMVAVTGLVISFVWAAEARDNGPSGDFFTLAAFSQGFVFFGMHLVLIGISFILGTILGSLRQGGGEVQEHLGVGVKTLGMPFLVKGFLALMMTGMMLAITHFVTYLVVAGLDNPATIQAFFAWLGPLRKATVGIILSGILLSLAAIGTNVLPFQFWRIQQLIREGR